MKSVARSHTGSLSKIKYRGTTVGGLASLALLAATHTTQAAELKIGEDAGLTAGIGLRTSYTSAKNGAPNGTSRSNDFNLENTRLFLSGHYKKSIKATFNVERNANDGVRVLDAIAQFEPIPEFNIWMGRLLPPQDRANGYGPFYALPWSYPGVVSNYPQIENGRDNGVMVWGKPFGGKLTYSVGAFEGHNKAAGYSAQSDKLAISGRLVAHIWDPEPAPAHLSGGWYGGSNDILSIGIAGYTQKDGVGTAAQQGDLNIWNADLLVEKKFAFGVPTLELGYYQYKLGALDCGSGEPGAPACPAIPLGTTGPANSGGMAAGKAMLVGVGFLIPTVVGWGQFQPFARYQKFDRSASATTVKSTDFGVNYIINGPKAKLTAMYTKGSDTRVAIASRDTNVFTFGVQLQY